MTTPPLDTHPLDAAASSAWASLLGRLWDAMQHGSVQDEWFAAGVLADWLEDQGDRPITYWVPYSASGDLSESCRDAARRLRWSLAMDRQQTAESRGRRGNWSRIDLTLDRTDGTRADGLLLPERRYSM